ncbi:MAG: hypothetical protein JNM81_13830 [Rhodospirillaceae bacterium]|nr:hypothetical protein [Rhodospirillaceae bacterium]
MLHHIFKSSVRKWAFQLSTISCLALTQNALAQAIQEAQPLHTETAVDKRAKAFAEEAGEKIETGKFPYLPDRYIVSQDPPGMQSVQPIVAEQSLAKNKQSEKPTAVSGQIYNVIAPLYMGGGPDGGNTSYIRIYNIELFDVTLPVSVVGYPSASTLGTAFIKIPKGASPQYSIGDILSRANVPSSIGGNTGIALYALNVLDDSLTYQHVIYNSNSAFFENMTLCGGTTISDLNRVLTNVHTSRIPGYPASIVFHNYSPLDVAYYAFISDSETGALATTTTFKFTAKANTTYLFPMSYIEQQTGFQPSASQFHVNFLFSTQSSLDTYRGIVGQVIYNQNLQAYINMTQICGLSK